MEQFFHSRRKFLHKLSRKFSSQDRNLAWKTVEVWQESKQLKRCNEVVLNHLIINVVTS